MKWKKLEYGEWPEGEIVLRMSLHSQIDFAYGYISRSKLNNEVYFYVNKSNDFRGVSNHLSIDSIYDTEPHYISLNEIEMP